MIHIVDTEKYYDCLSCGRNTRELLRTFNIKRNDQIAHSITLCTECLGELVRQEILYQPREDYDETID